MVDDLGGLRGRGRVCWGEGMERKLVVDHVHIIYHCVAFSSAS